MTNKLTLDELKARGYVDVVGGNLPLDGIEGEIRTEINAHHPSEVIVTYDCDSGRATIYITKEDFDKGAKR